MYTVFYSSLDMRCESIQCTLISRLLSVAVWFLSLMQCPLMVCNCPWFDRELGTRLQCYNICLFNLRVYMPALSFNYSIIYYYRYMCKVHTSIRNCDKTWFQFPHKIGFVQNTQKSNNIANSQCIPPWLLMFKDDKQQTIAIPSVNQQLKIITCHFIEDDKQVYMYVCTCLQSLYLMVDIHVPCTL